MTNKRIWAGVVCIALISLICLSGSIHAEEKSGQTPLVLTGAIPLPNVQGRIDHFGFDAKGRVFVSALGNNTLEVIDTSAQRDVHTITDVPTPQGVVFSPETNKLFVASAKGKLYVYDGASFVLLTSVDFGGDADNLRYDAATKQVYIGYGEDDAGAIAVIDAKTNKRLDDVKVGAHPESFQLEFSGPRVFVNLPDTKEVAVVNRKTHEVRKWQMTLGGNFPMALDEADHRIFVATRSPARLVVLDADSGHMVATLPSVQDADDLYFDAERKRIYVPGGEGYISVFQQRDPDHYDLIVKIQTAVGARTAGYFGKMGKKGFDRLYLAVPARAGRQAEIQIYTVQD
jgi:DNA-binding beta-propeller fold protein YncE